MKLEKKYKIEKAASDDESRAVLNTVSLEGNKLVATDGKIVAVVPIRREEKDADILIPTKAVAIARKGTKRDSHEISFDLEGPHINVLTRDGAVTQYQNAAGTFPKWEQCVPKECPKDDYQEITLNPHLLLRLAEALGVDKHHGITLKIRKGFETDPIRVDVRDKNKDEDFQPYGIIMPMRK